MIFFILAGIAGWVLIEGAGMLITTFVSWCGEWESVISRNIYTSEEPEQFIGTADTERHTRTKKFRWVFAQIENFSYKACGPAKWISKNE